ncbi:hypothetical protein MN116_007461 [Schistosoma mekongi]|uniref:GYF domain-containing protein n=1 Tax=Schistosoma mekongi TaxID=38744 RepID=A0AAE1ZA21_SCHME|nr:hypothetical protein MN116_007461 [Schistosoma mekongi]
MMSLAENSAARQRVRYSREEILARRVYGDSTLLANELLGFKTKTTENRASRSKPQRKKTSHSQSSDGDAQKTHVSSGEDLATQEGDLNSHGWHRTNRYAWHTQSSYSSHHPHQRYPSGSTGNVDPPTPTPQVNGRLRPTNETKRGGHGDWSRGCAGWRQRSYSGSEQSDVFYHNPSNYRGRGNGHVPSDVDGNTGRGRGRGRGSGRQSLTHRESICSQPLNSNSNNTHRIASCLVDTASGQSVQQTKNRRIYSKSFCIDPPPGFDLPLHGKPDSEPSSATTIQKEEFFVVDKDSVFIHHHVNGDSSLSSTQVNTKHYVHPCNWYYIDLSKCVQGPFTNQQMATWLASGHLPLAVKIRRDCDECFLSLADHMNLAGRIPFWVGYNQPPITHANLSTLSGLNDSNNNQISIHPADTTLSASSNPPTAEIHNVTSIVSSSQSTLTTFNEEQIQQVNINADGSDISQVITDKIPIFLNVPTLKTISSTTDSPELQTVIPSSLTEINEKALLNLYNETQSLVAHTSKIEAERLALANKLAEINSTTAKLLSNLCPTQLSSTLTESLIRTTNAVQIELARILEPTNNKISCSQMETINATTDSVSDNDVDATIPSTSDCNTTTPSSGIELFESSITTTSTTSDNIHAKEIYPVNIHISTNDELNTNANNETPSISVINNNEYDNNDQHTDHVCNNNSNNHNDDVDDDNNQQLQLIKESVSPCTKFPPSEGIITTQTGSSNHELETPTTKKSRRKHKKSNKKLSSDELRQLAWESEFNRRKAAALEQSLAEEARLEKLAKEEAAAIAAEKALAIQEELRTIAEYRKRKISRMKADSELAALKLPESAQWAGSNTNTAEKTPVMDLRSIQAAQAAEEAKKKYHDALMSEQVAVLTAAEATLSTKSPVLWSQVATYETTHSTPANTTCLPKNNKITEHSKHTVVMPSKNSSTQKTNIHSTNTSQLDYLKTTPIVCSSSKTVNSLVSSHTNTTSTSSTSVVSCTSKVKNNIVNNTMSTKTLNNPSIPSIWDLPVTTNNLDNTKVMMTGKKSNSKKKKKNREVSLFPAKEELAHWCESQLSSIPLSGVDLPTLVDLLCELQATDEIVEFIESSLGRSKRISQFSRDFLQKRALFRE